MGLINILEDKAEIATTSHRDGNVIWRIWGEGPPLVLLHGGTGSWQHWARNITSLSKDFRLYLPDIPGQGSSCLLENSTMTGLADALADGIEQLEIDSGYVLCGFSFGGYLGAHLLKRHHQKIKRLILVGSVGIGPMNDLGADLQNWSKFETKEQRDQAHIHNIGVLLLARKENIDPLALAIQRYNAESVRMRARDLFRDKKITDLLADYSVPVGALWGSQDALINGHFDAIIKALQQIDTNVEIQLVPGMGHWVQFEAPEEVNNFIRAVIRSI